MFNYKNLMKSINIEGKQDDETDTNDMYDIKNIETNGNSENLLDSIIQHPFIEPPPFIEDPFIQLSFCLNIVLFKYSYV